MPELISIGVSALLANQTNLSTTGHNIANANTEGYSRQRAQAVTTPAQPTAVGFEGSGVTVEGIQRLADLFAAAELRSTGDTYNRLERLLENSEQLDNVLGEESTGLSPILQRFFGSVQTASEDPASVASRQVVLTSAELLTNRVNELSDRLTVQNLSINTQLQTLTAQATTLAKSVAGLNEKISVYASAPLGRLPNDLLDERDRILQQISEIMNVQVLENDDRTVNLYVGSGQALVVGNRSLELFAAEGSDDGTRYDVVYQNGDIEQRITDQVVGGKMGGLLEFRNNVLDESYGQLGVVALGLAESVNNQHQLGMDLDGELGGNFFRDVNDPVWASGRVSPEDSNSNAGSETIYVNIQSVAEMTTSDYMLQFSPSSVSSYIVIRESDGVQVAQRAFSGTFPSTVEFDGVEVSIEAGDFAAGDEFLLSPSRFAAREISMNVSNVRDLAFAQPIRVEVSEANRGTGKVNQGEVVDVTTSLFDNLNTTKDLSPPLIVRFTTATSYEVLDNSDPANPVALVPPLANQEFVPGMNNRLLPDNLNQQTVSSDGDQIGLAVRNAITGDYDNGYGSEDLVITSVDPDTSVISRQTLTTTAGSSAFVTANELSALDNTKATASNYVVLDEINSTTPMILTLNGVNFGVTNPSELAISINESEVIAALGITAKSNGSQVELTSTTGIDFQIQVTGGATDSLTVQGRNGSAITVAGDDAIPEVTIGGHIEVEYGEGSSMTGVGSVFSRLPTHYPAFLGIQVTMSGTPTEGDLFSINYNEDGYSDNRNIVALGGIQTKKFMFNGEGTIRDAYANLINFVGTSTNEASLSYEAAQTLYERAVAEREATSGVNLDEEAANVIKYEQAYNASAQLISVARSIFDALLASVG